MCVGGGGLRGIGVLKPYLLTQVSCLQTPFLVTLLCWHLSLLAGSLRRNLLVLPQGKGLQQPL